MRCFEPLKWKKFDKTPLFQEKIGRFSTFRWLNSTTIIGKIVSHIYPAVFIK